MMLKPSRILYLHGLGGSPRSSKALLVANHFATRGIRTEIPDLAIPSLPDLSPRSIVEFVADEIARLGPAPLAVVGSSFGAFVAAQSLLRLPQESRHHVQSLVLLAPVIEPWDSGSKLLSPEVEERWRREGSMLVEDLERREQVPVHFRFVEELKEVANMDIVPVVPTLVVHGTRDETVSAAQSERFAKRNPGVELKLLDDDHRLLGQPVMLMSLVEGFIQRSWQQTSAQPHK